MDKQNKRIKTSILQGSSRNYLLSDYRLGRGAYSEVFEARDEKDPSLKFAVKIIRKKRVLNEADQIVINREKNSLQSLNHENIINLEDFIDEVE